MNKTWLIIKREYLSRVTKKTFILTTFLTPILFIGLIAAVVFITVKSVKEEKIAVDEANGVLKEFITDEGNIKYEFVANADTSLLSKGYTGVLLAPGTGINKTPVYQVYSRKSKSDDVTRKIKRQVNEATRADLIMREAKLTRVQYDSMMVSSQQAEVNNQVLNESNETTQGNFEVASGIGYAAGFLIYITLFLYGAMVMRGVMEEKTNRIAEVIISSVKPRQLMMGKIIGIGAVGLTQFILWIVLMTVLSTVLGSFIPQEALIQAQQAQNGMPGAMNQGGSEAIRNLAAMKTTMSTVNWPLIIGCFIFYFLGGYLFYAALFAAVGSAVNEDPQDAQSLMFPITLPIVLAIIIMINAIRQPDSSLATWSSMIPFFSPIVMMARLPFGPSVVPWWQLLASMALLVAGFLFTIWLSAKIYRTGILMYGKKVTLKELGKWAFRK
ncbi:MAG: ABC transporter permease [Bacteroidota bacterium]